MRCNLSFIIHIRINIYTMSSKYSVPINSLNDLVVRVQVLGGKDQGESIIILIYDKDSYLVHRVFLIDSFKGIHGYLKRLQAEYNFRCLNAVCWTHPHEDHTVEIEDIMVDEKLTILSNKQSETRFVLPQVTERFDHKCCIYKDNVKLINLRPQNKIGLNAKQQYNKNNLRWEFVEHCSKQSHFVTLRFITPSYNLGQRHLHISEYEKKRNEMSLSCVFMIDDIPYIYFGGDSIDPQVQYIEDKDKKMVGKCPIVKIPHHGSRESLGILEFISNNLDLAVCTIFRKSDPSKNLPKRETIDRYNQKLSKDGKLFITDKPFDDINCEWGVADFSLECCGDDKFHLVKSEIYGIDKNYNKLCNN